jgi:hypothetical protein
MNFREVPWHSNDLVTSAQQYFPKLKIAYKDKSVLMRLLGKILFFRKDFMGAYTTTVGNTVYIPSQNFIKLHPISGSVVLLHELVHFHDQKKWSKALFLFLYFFPQALAPLAILLFLLGWKIALPVMILCAAPVPAFFRMYFEKRAYLSSLYVLHRLGDRLKFNPHLASQTKCFVEAFGDASYYWMWPFKKAIRADFEKGIKAIQAGERPYQSSVFDMLDDLITKV